MKRVILFSLTGGVVGFAVGLVFYSVPGAGLFDFFQQSQKLITVLEGVIFGALLGVALNRKNKNIESKSLTSKDNIVIGIIVLIFFLAAIFGWFYFVDLYKLRL